jgi:uncharacterized protein YqgV (UPF0045/DUF77 family)
MEDKMVNVAVQVLPVAQNKRSYDIVDAAIAVIDKSGVKYMVTPFETVMEGKYADLMKVVNQVQAVCYDAGADAVMCYVKIQSQREGVVTIMDKMAKYE